MDKALDNLVQTNPEGILALYQDIASYTLR